MTSQINYLGINENFPVAGQDNDTQTFRDNFDTIKTSLRYAGEEITDLQNNTAKLDQTNDFGLNVISNVQFQNTRNKVVSMGNVPLPAATTSVIEIDFENGHHHVLRAVSNITLTFTNFPGDPNLNEEGLQSVGKTTLELYGDGTARIISFSTSAGTVIKKDPSFPGVLSVTSTADPIIIEVWRRGLEVIYLRYVGLFS